MCGKSMNMMEVCRKMPSKVRLKKIGLHQSMKGQFTIKYLIFREIWKILCCPNFLCVVTKFPVFSLSGKINNQIPPVFPVPWPPCYIFLLSCREIKHYLKNLAVL